jgi:hypothetical protein
MTWMLLALAGFAILPKTALAGQFKAPVYYAAPGLPWAVVSADFNHDGNLDLAVADAHQALCTRTSGCRIVVSADGKSRTVSTNGTDSKGNKVKSTAVYDNS